MSTYISSCSSLCISCSFALSRNVLLAPFVCVVQKLCNNNYAMCNLTILIYVFEVKNNWNNGYWLFTNSHNIYLLHVTQ